MDYAVNEMDLDEGSIPVRPHPYPRGAEAEAELADTYSFILWQAGAPEFQPR